MAETQEESSDWGRVHAAILSHQASLIRYAASIVGERERAKDVVQEVFLKLCKARWRDVEGHLANWLFRVTRNQALDVLRKEKRMSLFENSETMERLAGVGEESITEMRRQETIHSLLDLVSQLPGKEREIVTLKFQEGLSYKEISKVTGMTVSNVGYILHHAIRDLKSRWKAVESV